MNIFSKTLILFISLGLIGGNFLFSQPASAALELVKIKSQDTIYYIDNMGDRHAFLDDTTYRSWYGNDYSKIVTVPLSFLQTYSLGKNITIRPGTYLVKTPTLSSVYAVESGSVLRPLSDEKMAAAIYGQDWAKRVVEMPDIFMQNYTMGQPITHDYTVTDGSLYYDNKTKKYYFKNNSIIQPFASTQAVLANGFKLSDAVSSNWTYTVREKPINGLDKNIFNPLMSSTVSSSDCENKKLKAAFIFLPGQDYTQNETDKIKLIQKQLGDRYSWATDGLSSLESSSTLVILKDDGYLVKKRSDGITEIKNEVINTFYDNNPDDFDFIFIFTNFKVATDQPNEIAHFASVTNRVDGINRGIFDWSSMFGSTGKLKGIIVMGDVNKYHPESVHGLNEVMNYSLHEILHNWGAYITFIDQNGQRNAALLKDKDYLHWSYYDAFVSPLGGSGWVDNGNGTFTNAMADMADSNLKKFSSLDLYIMGLIPAQLMPPIMYVEPKIYGAYGNTIEGTAHYVTIDQIIAANGKVLCSPN